jgi:hypothetical protein
MKVNFGIFMLGKLALYCMLSNPMPFCSLCEAIPSYHQARYTAVGRFADSPGYIVQVALRDAKKDVKPPV